MKNRKFITTVAALAIASTMMIIGGCSKEEPARSGVEETTATTTAAEVEETQAPDQTEEVSESETEAVIETEYESPTGMKDGDKYDVTIMLEGMEETVSYEHVINSGVGFEMDFECEILNRVSEADKETFISMYEDQSNPQIFFEVEYEGDSTDNVASSISSLLSGSYELTQDTYKLDNAGACTRIVASSTTGDNTVQTIYIIPAGNGSVVATAHYTLESTEGFGSRFNQMANTIIIIENNSANLTAIG
ncbi:MAG: hypothetical protein K6G47_08690 [Clostridia bacterium]|nr:hypothetical protein [Clostridia bacterium]